MSTTPAATVPSNPYPEGFDHAEWAWFGSYARMIEWTAGSMIIALFILIGLPFYCIIALPVLLGCAVANLPVSDALVDFLARLKGRWSNLPIWRDDGGSQFISRVLVPRIYRLLGFLVFLVFPVLLSWSVNSRIDMVVAKRIALVEETLKVSQATVDTALTEMRETALANCRQFARHQPSVNCDDILRWNVSDLLAANKVSSAYRSFEPAFQVVNKTQQELAKIRSRVLPNPGLLQIIFDLLPTCLDSIRQQTSWRPVAGMCFTLGFLMALFELLDRYGPWIQYRYPLLRATWVASGLFLLAGTALLYLTNEAIVWPDVSRIVDLKYGLEQTYEQTMQRLEEIRSSRGVLDYYLSMVLSITISVAAFIAIGLGTYITGKKSMAMYLVGFFLFFLAAEAQFDSLTTASKHFSLLLFPVLAGSSLLLAYGHFTETR